MTSTHSIQENSGSTRQAQASALEPLIVHSSHGDYPVHVDEGLLARVGEILRGLGGQVGPAEHCAVVTDTHVARLHADALLASLRGAGFKAALCVAPAGEASKSLAETGRLCESFGAHGLDRRGFVVALGGGVVGDLAGFAASVYQRGVPCVQVPTTVTSQIDSAIGGKTGVNTDNGKNQVGSFSAPAAVLADVNALATLPEREFAEGCAEAIKHAAIRDRELFDRFAAVSVGGDQRAFMDASIIRRNVKIKAELVGEDEFERTGRRALLNFGHTLGHAIESAAGYGRYSHGEAVSLGMVAAAGLSVRKAGLAPDERARLVATLAGFGLPTRLSEALPAEAVLASLRLDKKFEAGRIRFVLLSRLGEARLSEPDEITWEDLRRAAESLA